MLRFPTILILAGASIAFLSCNAGRHSSAGFRLPSDGDIERGKTAFVALECHTCHEVAGTDLPRPTVQPPVPVVLGGDVVTEKTDGYLVTSIVNPSFVLASYPKDKITVDGRSRMPHDYAGKLTVQQLTDIVAFLQSQYHLRALYPPRY